MSTITLDDVLDLKHLQAWEWSPDSSRLAYLWEDGGKADLWVVNVSGGEPQRLTQAKRGVSGFSWHPKDGRLALVLDGNMWEARPTPEGYQLRQITQTAENEGNPGWSPAGSILSFTRGGSLWLHHEGTGLIQHLALPGQMTSTFGGGWGSLGWSPGGHWIAFSFMDAEKRFHAGVVDLSGKLAWQSRHPDPPGGCVWVDADTLAFAVSHDNGHRRSLYLVDLAGAKPKERLILEVTGDGRGPLFLSGLYPSPDGKLLLHLLENHGWAHLYLQDAAGGKLRQLTFGECEDFGQAGDAPSWAPDGQTVVYSSNRGNPTQRQLWVLDIRNGQGHQLTDLPGTNLAPKFSPDGSRLAFLHSDPWKSCDLWVMDTGRPQTARQLTRSMPPAWTPQSISVPEEVTYRSAADWEISGMLVKPVDMDPTRRYPALVWVHGGPIRQMRWGWHPSRAYAIFDAFHQYLAHRGYVSISINFRGGIGYGRDFRQGIYHKMGVDDVADVVNAGRFLKSLPYVDPERVGVWGISYGGYMTLHALTQYPGEFALGINLAGIYDFSQWQRWVRSRWGRVGGLFTTYLGGEPEDSPELYAQASPVTFVDNLRDPLVNLHGTADANVDFAQLDRIVEDCVRLGKTYEAHYYPGEAHSFIHRHTWRDAFNKIEAAMNKYLRG
ncbi:MAG: S9 family peptidase [Bacillota bacterium]